jgi:hypothetical protein
MKMIKPRLCASWAFARCLIKWDCMEFMILIFNLQVNCRAVADGTKQSYFHSRFIEIQIGDFIFSSMFQNCELQIDFDKRN